MKLSFSTLGCPEWSVEQICENGAKWGYQGAGIRGILGEFDLTKIPELNDENRARTMKTFADNGMTIIILGTSARFSSGDPAERQKNFDDAKAAIDLAQKLDCRMIRVFGGKIPDGVKPDDAYVWVAENFKRLADYAATKNVIVTIETHDDFTDTYLVRDIVERTDHDHMRVLWDVHHTFRACGHSMQLAWDNLGRYVTHTHFKDSKLDPSQKSGFKYCFMGEGDIPNVEALQILKDNNYGGFLSLEWEKAWHPYLDDASVAFPQYAEKMREYMAGLKEAV